MAKKNQHADGNVISNRKKTNGGRKKGGAKSAGRKRTMNAKKPRPKLPQDFQNLMRTLRDNLRTIIAEGEDNQGTLSKEQLLKAVRMELALDQAVTEVYCVQTLIAY